ncbi:hypothetical protein Micbo1qcDRAFT_161500 [Microdochium bolleyi]|uniref:Uncharacterized protein n=1 Tax=Microdochium bolleyi TaxID=196109 RepID=A0A136J8K3_9PEZI|nr:hypothetical protein Micbo1qcDRAFT_161500 [Microdochium bolleyi]
MASTSLIARVLLPDPRPSWCRSCPAQSTTNKVHSHPEAHLHLEDTQPLSAFHVAAQNRLGNHPRSHPRLRPAESALSAQKSCPTPLWSLTSWSAAFL